MKWMQALFMVLVAWVFADLAWRFWPSKKTNPDDYLAILLYALMWTTFAAICASLAISLAVHGGPTP